jgi:apolipoprotein D and lipocalin family protein
VFEEIVYIRSLIALLVGGSVLGLAGCAATPKPVALRTVAHVDLTRYMGNWYVIANIPYVLENGKVASYDTYAPRADGRMNNVFTFRKGSFSAPEKSWHGVAWVVNKESNAEWRVRFLWPLYTTYLVLELDPDYRWAVVATPGHKLLWVLARDRSLDAPTYAAILQRIAAQGYDVNRLAKVPQPVGP